MVEDISPETLRERDPKKLIPPLHGALIKNEQDVHLFERLAFMARREKSLKRQAITTRADQTKGACRRCRWRPLQA